MFRARSTVQVLAFFPFPLICFLRLVSADRRKASRCCKNSSGRCAQLKQINVSSRTFACSGKHLLTWLNRVHFAFCLMDICCVRFTTAENRKMGWAWFNTDHSRPERVLPFRSTLTELFLSYIFCVSFATRHRHFTTSCDVSRAYCARGYGNCS